MHSGIAAAAVRRLLATATPPRMITDITETHQKALRTNRDARLLRHLCRDRRRPGMARWFFRVGGASGSVAKTICAYDMTVSDALYGSAGTVREPATVAGHAES
jgi:hypothetical protein